MRGRLVLNSWEYLSYDPCCNIINIPYEYIGINTYGIIKKYELGDTGIAHQQ